MTLSRILLQGYIFWPFLLPPGGGGIFVQIEKQKDLKEDSKKGRDKGGKEEKKVIKHTLKYLYEA